ncbi:MAG: hypothetical protein V3T22_03135, partial [Planctomycetota bacterium]
SRRMGKALSCAGSWLPLLACGAALLSGCVVAAVGLTVAVVSHEFTNNAQLAFMREDHRVVWEQVKLTLDDLAPEPVEIDDELQAARCTIDSAAVTVYVEIFDVGETKLSVTARKWGVYDSDSASSIITRIKRDLGR